jgi:integrase
VRTPYSLFTRTSKKTGKTTWYARFWDEEAGRYSRAQVLNVPFAGRRNGRDLAIQAAQAEVAKMKRETDPLVIDFVTAFWAPGSRHIRSREIVDQKPLSLAYLDHNRRAIQLYIAPYPGFKTLRLSKLKAGIVKDWQLWAMEHGATPRSCNIALQALKVPIRDAVMRGEISADPLTIVKKVPEHPRERGVLTIAEINALIKVDEHDPRIKAAILLATLGGLRRGEIRGLRWGDIDWSMQILHVRHNTVDQEEDKAPKAGSARTIPLHNSVLEELRKLFSIAPLQGDDDFVFFSTSKPQSPLSGRALLDGLYRMLEAIGINKEQRIKRNLNLHAMRHSFITLARNLGMPDISVMALSGHKSPQMLTRYSHGSQVVNYQMTKYQLEQAINP